MIDRLPVEATVTPFWQAGSGGAAVAAAGQSLFQRNDKHLLKTIEFLCVKKCYKTGNVFLSLLLCLLNLFFGKSTKSVSRTHIQKVTVRYSPVDRHTTLNCSLTVRRDHCSPPGHSGSHSWSCLPACSGCC